MSWQETLTVLPHPAPAPPQRQLAIQRKIAYSRYPRGQSIAICQFYLTSRPSEIGKGTADVWQYDHGGSLRAGKWTKIELTPSKNAPNCKSLIVLNALVADMAGMGASAGEQMYAMDILPLSCKNAKEDRDDGEG